MGNRHLTYFNKMTVEIKDALSEYSVLRRNALINRTTSAKTGDMDAVDRSQFGRKGAQYNLNYKMEAEAKAASQSVQLYDHL